jgi:hypothetical protein
VHSTETLSGNSQEIPMQENKLDRSQSIEGHRPSDIDPSEKLQSDDHSYCSKKRSESPVAQALSSGQLVKISEVVEEYEESKKGVLDTDNDESHALVDNSGAGEDFNDGGSMLGSQLMLTENCMQKIMKEIENINPALLEGSNPNLAPGMPDKKENEIVLAGGVSFKNILKMIRKKGEPQKIQKDDNYCESVASSLASVAGLDTLSMLSKAMNRKISIGEISYLSIILAFFIILYAICMVFFESVLGGMHKSARDIWQLERKWSLLGFSQNLYFYYTMENLYYRNGTSVGAMQANL